MVYIALGGTGALTFKAFMSQKVLLNCGKELM
ncbi:hypothetical protein GLO73106DRAFT_00041070 [Gloeocapsa sp. PCC 73106]|nr:hypothetical protein GLO73106DRAFT_00041070 [Gloeocapsa sp. PCC 73106]